MTLMNVSAVRATMAERVSTYPATTSAVAWWEIKVTFPLCVSACLSVFVCVCMHACVRSFGCACLHACMCTLTGTHPLFLEFIAPLLHGMVVVVTVVAVFIIVVAVLLLLLLLQLPQFFLFSSEDSLSPFLSDVLLSSCSLNLQ